MQKTAVWIRYILGLSFPTQEVLRKVCGGTRTISSVIRGNGEAWQGDRDGVKKKNKQTNDDIICGEHHMQMHLISWENGRNETVW